jgi:hypothetical protein
MLGNSVIIAQYIGCNAVSDADPSPVAALLSLKVPLGQTEKRYFQILMTRIHGDIKASC